MLYSQPQSGPLSLDSGNPITRGLVLAQTGDPVAPFSPFGGLAGTTNTKGRAKKFVAASSQYLTAAVSIDPNAVTMLVIASMNTTSADYALMSLGGSSSDRALMYLTNLGQPAMFSANAGGYDQAVGTPLTAGPINTYVGRVTNSSSRDVWVNGVSAASSTGFLSAGACSVAAVGAYYLNGSPNAGFYHDGNVNLALLWNRALTNAEIASITANPWQVFLDHDDEDETLFYVAQSVGGITGSLTSTEGTDTIASSGSVLIGGTLAKTEGADTLSAAGSVLVSGTLATIEPSDSLASSGTVGSAVMGTMAITEGGDTGSGAGSVLIGGALARTEGADSLTASGSVSGGAPITGTLAVSEAPDTLAATNIVAVPGSGGGGAGSVRDVRAFAHQFDRTDRKPSKAQKKRIRSELVEEALELLPDTPEAEAIAPVIAQLVYAQTAPAFANWSPARAMEPLPPAVYEAMRAKVDAFLQQIALQEEIDDEHVIELLLLG